MPLFPPLPSAFSKALGERIKSIVFRDRNGGRNNNAAGCLRFRRPSGGPCWLADLWPVALFFRNRLYFL